MTMKDANTLFETSKKLVPGGVHSPVRSFKGLDMAPRFVTAGKGAMITDTEGKDYIDFCMSFGPLILGHGNEEVKEELKKALDRGWSYGACEPYSLELAQYIIERIPFIEQLRFVNSGTEAVMTALRLARGATGRNKIIKFNGCYHGHSDAFLIKAGSGLAGTSEASSAGVPEGTAQDTLILDLDDEQSLKECMEREGDKIAAIFIEPLPANNGLLPQRIEFLKLLRTLTEKHGALLVFDEVISGFRVAFGGMAELTGITPDLVTYGKVIGGGLPVGAIAGPVKIMENLAPVGNVYQAGTLSANPLAMVGGLATLKQLTPSLYTNLQKNADRVGQLFEKWFKEYKNGEFSDYQLLREQSLFWAVPGLNAGEKIRDISHIPQQLITRFNPLFKTLLQKGIYLSPNGYEVGFLSAAHDENVIAKLEERLYSK